MASEANSVTVDRELLERASVEMEAAWKALIDLLGHASIQTTGDIYADWDIDQLATTLRDVLEGES